MRSRVPSLERDGLALSHRDLVLLVFGYLECRHNGANHRHVEWHAVLRREGRQGWEPESPSICSMGLLCGRSRKVATPAEAVAMAAHVIVGGGATTRAHSLREAHTLRPRQPLLTTRISALHSHRALTCCVIVNTCTRSKWRAITFSQSFAKIADAICRPCSTSSRPEALYSSNRSKTRRSSSCGLRSSA
eukprot:scaffold166212_cov28-Tisochrysis_lutea.AAC.4